MDKRWSTKMAFGRTVKCARCSMLATNDGHREIGASAGVRGAGRFESADPRCALTEGWFLTRANGQSAALLVGTIPAVN
jgi:hypothetical protein